MVPTPSAAADCLVTAPLELLEGTLRSVVRTSEFAAANPHLTAAELAMLRRDLVFTEDKPLWSPNKPSGSAFYVSIKVSGSKTSVRLHRMAGP
jgi:hypothetical protein